MKSRPQETGSAIIEMALVLPVLLLLVLGIVDFGRALNYWNDTNHLAGMAARFAAVNKNPGADLSPPVTDFRQWVRNQAETGELRDGDAGVAGGGPASTSGPLKVCVTLPSGSGVGNPIKVTVSNGYELVPYLRQKTTAGDALLTISGEATMRIEQAYTGPTGCTS